MNFPVYFDALYAVLGFGFIAWIWSLVRRDVSIVDSLWSLFFLLAAIVFASQATSLSARGMLVVVLVTIWATRLSVYISARNWGEPEDYRYQAIRAKNEPGFAWKSIYIVFGLQGVLAWIVAMPLLPAISASAPLAWLDYIAVLIWSIGFVFEAGGDLQLAAFRRNPANEGKVLDSGLWRYTRHPNYFGDFCIWWSFYLFAVAAGGWWSIVSPIVMTLLLLKVSGVAMLERTISRRRPDYEDYIRRTNAFFPGPPRRPVTRGEVE